MKKILLPLLGSLAFAGSFISVTTAAEPPKKLLVVTTTAGYRHSSIPLAEKAIARLGEESGVFTVDFVQQPEGKPASVTPPKPPAADATPEVQAAYKAAEEKFKAAQAADAQ